MSKDEILKKCLDNLYKLLVQEQNYSIYREVDFSEKLFPFVQIFDLKQQKVYNLSSLETEIIRTNIGIWDEGKKQSKTSIHERTSLQYMDVDKYLKQAVNKFYVSTMQEMIVNERNTFIKANIGCLENKILNSCINFIHMPIAYKKLLIDNGFKTIGDLVDIKYEDIIKLNKNKEYNSVITFPRHIVETVHSLGLSFKNEEMFAKMYEDDEKIDDILGCNWKQNRCSDISVWLRYKSDLISLYQFTNLSKQDYDFEKEIGYTNFNKLKEVLDEYLMKSQNELEKLRLESNIDDLTLTGLEKLLCDVFSDTSVIKKIGKK